MKAIIKILAAVLILMPIAGATQESIEGTWQGRLTLGPDQTLTVQFIITQADDGSLSSVINSPDMGGIKNIPAQSTEFDGNNLKIDVAELSGAYTGVLTDGSFEGEWTQAGQGMALILSPYEKPVMTQAEIDILLGEWVGKLNIPAGELTLVFRFAQNEGGELQGFVRSPDQGGNEAPAADILLQDGVFSMKVPAAQVQITGNMSATDFTGKFQQGPQQLDLNMTKGAYEQPENPLDLPEEAIAQLMGEWHGEVETPMGNVAVVYRFEKNDKGNFVAFRDNVDQGATGISVTEVSLTDGAITIVNPGPGGTYSGKLDGEAITGQLQGPMGAVPFNLVKGKYVAPSYALALSDDAKQQLDGKWTGKLQGPRELTLVFRFEEGEGGEYFAFVDSPDQGANGLKVTEVTLEGDKLMLKTRFPAATYNGTLAGGELSGNWAQMNNTTPLNLAREE